VQLGRGRSEQVLENGSFDPGGKETGESAHA
jgi:hypothetical protein